MLDGRLIATNYALHFEQKKAEFVDKSILIRIIYIFKYCLSIAFCVKISGKCSYI